MLSVGPGARRLSPSQNIHIKRQLPDKSVIFITDTAPQLGCHHYNGTMEVHSSLLSVVLHDQPHITDKTGASREE